MRLRGNDRKGFGRLKMARRNAHNQRRHSRLRTLLSGINSDDLAKRLMLLQKSDRAGLETYTVNSGLRGYAHCVRAGLYSWIRSCAAL